MGNMSCPKCGMYGYTKKNGHTKSTGEQRYLCTKCRNTFQRRYKNNKFEDIEKEAAAVVKVFNDHDIPTLKEKAEQLGTTPYMLRKLRGDEYEGAQREKEKRLAKQFQDYKLDNKLNIVCPSCKTDENIICKKMITPSDEKVTSKYDCILYCADCKKEFKVTTHKKRCANSDCGSYDVFKQQKVYVKQRNEVKQVWRCKTCGRYFRSFHNYLRTHEHEPYIEANSLLEAIFYECCDLC
jgi:transposase-like protein